MQNIAASLEKIRWHQRYDKLGSLAKNLRYKQAEQVTISSFDVFLNLEKILLTFDDKYLEGRTFSENEVQTLRSLLTSFENLSIPENAFTHFFLVYDQKLNLTKCHFMLGNTQQVISQAGELFEETLTVEHAEKDFLNHSKYTWKLVAEVAIATATIFISNATALSFGLIMRMLNTTLYILHKLVKAQEQALLKRIKTSPTLHAELTNLLLLATELRAKIAIRNKCFSLKQSVSYSTMLQDLDLGQYDKFRFIIPFRKIGLSFCLAKWFSFSDTKGQEREEQLFTPQHVSIPSPILILSQTIPYLELVNTCTDILNLFSYSKISSEALRDTNSPDRHTVALCLNVLAVFLCQTAQFETAALLNLKYLAFFFEDTRRYFSLACALFSGGSYVHCLQLCRRTLELDPTDYNSRCLVLNMLINRFKNYDEAIELSTRYVASVTDATFLLARAVSYLEKSIESVSFSETQETLYLAKADILWALELDDNNHEVYFYAGLIFVLLDEPESAFYYACQATKRSIFDVRPYHLLFLVLVYRRLYEDAIQVLVDSEREFPHDFGLLLNKINFERYYYGPETALGSAKSVLEIWHSLYTKSIVTCQSEPGTGSRSSAGQRSTPALPLSVKSEKAFPLEQPLVIEGAVLTVEDTKIVLSAPQEIKDASLFLTILMTTMADLYYAIGDTEGLQNSLNEIFSLGLTSPDAFAMKAKFHAAKGERDQIRECLETALFLEPNHITSLYQYVQFCLEELDVYNKNESDNHSVHEDLVLAEETARHLVKVDARNFISWQCLGKVLHEAGKQDESAYCLKRALELESFCSILPFKTIFRHYRPSDANLTNVV